MSEDRNCLSYWFPRLLAAGLPVPRTKLLTMPEDCAAAIWAVLDGKCSKEQEQSIDSFAGQLADAADEVALGYPLFLRTGQFSGKHNWKETCFVAERKSLGRHVVTLAEMSEMFGMFGELPWTVWAVRELLPTKPVCTLPNYGDFPLVPEARCFVRDGKVVCWHSYWPDKSIAAGFPVAGGLRDDDARELPSNFADIVRAAHDLDQSAFMPLAETVAKAFKGDGGWSVDLLPTERGWFVTDMAIAERSFHWPECPHKSG